VFITPDFRVDRAGFVGRAAAATGFAALTATGRLCCGERLKGFEPQTF
jgi:hypothetical protein